MTIRNLDALFKPRSIALIGGSRRAGSLGAVLARNLFKGGFDGPILPVHPRHQSLEGVLAYPSVAALPLAPDLAVIATPPETVPQLVAELGARGTRAAVIITAGFSGDGNGEGSSLRQKLLEAAQPHLLRIVGPNCLGLLLPRQGINASFSHLAPPPGDPPIQGPEPSVCLSPLPAPCLEVMPPDAGAPDAAPADDAGPPEPEPQPCLRVAPPQKPPKKKK